MWIFGFYMTLITLQGGNASGVPRGYTVALDPFPDTVLLGASIPFSYALVNRSQQDLPLGGDSLGRSGMDVFDEAGSPVASTPKFAGPGPSRPQFYPLKPGEKVRLRYDLPLLFVLGKPGTYRLRLLPNEVAGRPADFPVVTPDGAQIQFTVASYRALDTRKLSGFYRPPYLGTSAVVGPEDASVRLSLVETEKTVKPLQFLLIDEIVVVKEPRIGLPRYSFAVPTGTSIEKAAMDYFGQVWVVVKAGDRMSLLLWRINDLSWSTLVGSTEKKIAMGTGQARLNVPGKNLVVAGVEGAEQFTTYSVAPYSFGGTGKADIGRGRQ